MRRIEPTSVLQLLRDLADENPRPQEKWIQRDNFDPMHGLNEIRAAARRGLIELDESDRDPETIRLRFTAAGRAALEE